MVAKPGIAHITLSQLTTYIHDVLDAAFKHTTFWVIADVIDCKPPDRKGHSYFCLAEKDGINHSVVAKLQAAAWHNHGGLAIDSFEKVTGQKFQNGIQILANVSVQYHPSYGLKLILNDVDSNFTIGMLEQERRITLEKLVALCPDFIQLIDNVYHTKNKSLQHASVIQRVAVVTSSEAAGFKDFRDAIENNRFGYKITLDTWFTAVQGEANAQGLCNRLIQIFLSGIPYDAVVIIRGGGSQSDLMIFEQFVLARAVAKFPIPIIAGIGHQINESIVDLMAHTSVKTPSVAAQFIIDHNRQFEQSLLVLQQTIIINAQQLLSHHQQALTQHRTTVINKGLTLLANAKDKLTHSYQSVISSGRKALYNNKAFLNEAGNKLVSRPKILTSSKRCDLENVITNLKNATRRYFITQRGYIAHHGAMTKALDPRNIMRRGFAVIYYQQEIVADASSINVKDSISIRMFESKLSATITTKTDLDGTIANL